MFTSLQLPVFILFFFLSQECTQYIQYNTRVAERTSAVTSGWVTVSTRSPRGFLWHTHTLFLHLCHPRHSFSVLRWRKSSKTALRGAEDPRSGSTCSRVCLCMYECMRVSSHVEVVWQGVSRLKSLLWLLLQFWKAILKHTEVWKFVRLYGSEQCCKFTIQTRHASFL